MHQQRAEEEHRTGRGFDGDLAAPVEVARVAEELARLVAVAPGRAPGVGSGQDADRPVGGDEDLITAVLQRLRREHANSRFVVNDEDRRLRPRGSHAAVIG